MFASLECSTGKAFVYGGQSVCVWVVHGAVCSLGRTAGTTMRVCAAHVARECEVTPIILMCLNTRPHDGAVREGCRTFRKWRLIGGDISLEMALELRGVDVCSHFLSGFYFPEV